VLHPNAFGILEGHHACVGADSPGQAGSKIRGYFPIVPGLVGLRHRSADARDAPLGVGHGAVLLAPAGGGQQHVGEGRGLGVGVGLLEDDELGFLERRAHAGKIRKRLHRVRAGDPEHLHLAARRGVEELDGGEAGPVRDARHVPQALHLSAVRRIAKVAVRREGRGEAAHLAPAHGVRLPGEAEGAGTQAPDLPGGQVQSDEGRVLRGAARRLVESLAVERERRTRAREPARGGDDVVGLDAADLRGPGGRAVARQRAHRIEAFRVPGDEAIVGELLPQHHVQHGVEERDIGAGKDGEVQIGARGGLRAARVDDDELRLRPALARLLQPAEEHRMRERRVGAGDEEALGVVEVLVARGRRIRAERLHVAGDAEDMHSRELVSMFAVPMRPLASLLKT
jgi:hypothetical protein